MIAGRFRNTSLIMQVLLAIVLLVVLFVFVGGEELKRKEREYLIKQTQQNSEQIFNTFVASNIDDIIAEDIPVLETAVSLSVDVNQDIVFLEVQNEDDLSLIKWGGPESGSMFLEFKKAIRFEGERFGKVTIIRSLANKHDAIEEHISNIYRITLMLLVAFVLVGGLVLYLFMTRPLLLIRDRLNHYLAGEPDKNSYQFLSREFNQLNQTVDKLYEVTENRDRLQVEVERRKQIQLELEQARLASEQANAAKTDFLSFMTHEIRTPLTAILGFSETLLETNQTMEQRLEAIHIIIQSGKHLLQLINDVLDVAKIETGKLEVDHVDVSIVSLLNDVSAIVMALSKIKGLGFEIKNTAPVPSHLQSDPLRLRQILINIIGNAVKFTREGKICLQLSYEEKDEILKFIISDTGIGMSEEQKSHLFEAYQQADISTAREFGGTGLGLYLTMILVDKLGGKIEVDSVEGEGTVFTFDIPVKKGGELIDINKLDFTRYDYSNYEHNDIQLSGRVLLADDVVDNQRLIAHFVEEVGAEVDLVSNGQEAIDKVMENDYDLVLMDIQMPVLDGLTAVKRIREMGYAVPVVSLSANTMSEDRKEYLAAGCNDTADKPVIRSEFRKLLRYYLKLRGDERQDMTPIFSSVLIEEGYDDLIDAFKNRLPELLSEIEQQFENKEWEKMKDSLHKLKGVAGNYGYESLMELMAKSEFALTGKNYESLGQLIRYAHVIEQRIMLAKKTNDLNG